MKTNIVNTEIYRHKNEFGTVALKSRKNGNNPQSLYLEIYDRSTQKRHLEFLNLYLTGNPLLDTQAKTIALGKCSAYVFETKAKDNLSFTDFCLEQVTRIDDISSRKNPELALRKLQEFAGVENIPFSKINEDLLLSFREWLLYKAPNLNYKKENRVISKNTAHCHLSCIMTYANRAQRKGLIHHSAYSSYEIPPIGIELNPPVTFTEDEIKLLQNTNFTNPKNQARCKALLLQFACGQRWGDVQRMTWEQIVLEGDVYKIVLKQGKTDKILPSFITKELMDWIAEDRERKGLILPDLPCDTTMRRHLNKWCKKAGIEKHVGTHTMRRSCATILYKKGVPLYTISKILGHSNTDITLRYIGIDERDIKSGLNALKDITSSFSYNRAS